MTSPSALLTMGVGGAAPAGGGITLTFNTSGNSTASTVTIPAGANIGDLAVLFDFGFGGGSSVTDVVPTDFTGLATNAVSVGSSRHRNRSSYKVLVSGDPGSAITGLNAATRNNKVILIFTPSSAITTVTPNSWSSNSGGTTISATAVTAPGIQLAMVSADSGTAAFGAGTTPSFSATVANSSADLLAGYTIYNSSPSSQDSDTDVAGGGVNAGGLSIA